MRTPIQERFLSIFGRRKVVRTSVLGMLIWRCLLAVQVKMSVKQVEIRKAASYEDINWPEYRR